jgi:hypothetical protein
MEDNKEIDNVDMALKDAKSDIPATQNPTPAEELTDD